MFVAVLMLCSVLFVVATLAEKQNRLQEVESIKEDASANYSRVSRLNEQLESEKLEMLSVVERKNQEIDRLNGKGIRWCIRL